jgi:hypothetical protein
MQGSIFFTFFERFSKKSRIHVYRAILWAKRT